MFKVELLSSKPHFKLVILLLFVKYFSLCHYVRGICASDDAATAGEILTLLYLLYPLPAFLINTVSSIWPAARLQQKQHKQNNQNIKRIYPNKTRATRWRGVPKRIKSENKDHGSSARLLRRSAHHHRPHPSQNSVCRSDRTTFCADWLNPGASCAAIGQECLAAGEKEISLFY